MKAGNPFVGLGILTGVASSLCCIVPLLALIAGTGTLVGAFAWLEPFRWFLVAISLLALGFAWYFQIRSERRDDCGCERKSPTSFFQSRTFLGAVTVFVFLSLAFPSYAKAFYPSSEKEVVLVQEKDVETVVFSVRGMTCAGCEAHVQTEIDRLKGIVSRRVSYEEGNTIVEFDNTLTNVEEVKAAMERTGYIVTKIEKQ